MEFAAATLIGVEDVGQTCSNGLPVAPSPTRMLSRFWKVAALNHPNLCKYFELIRCQIATNGVILVSEHYNRKYVDERRRKEVLDERLAYRVAHEVCAGVNYCHENRVVVGLITLENVLLHRVNRQLHVKLAQYGLYHVSGDNSDVDYTIGAAWYLAPERLVARRRRTPPSAADASGGVKPTDATFKSDVWSMGVLLVEIFTRKTLSEIWGVRQILSVLSAVFEKANRGSALIPLLDAMRFACPHSKICIPGQLLDTLDACLQILPSKRPSAATLLKTLSKIISTTTFDKQVHDIARLNGSHLDESIEEMKARLLSSRRAANDAHDEADDHFDFERPLGERYFLWKLCGSSVESILIARGVIRLKPPVCTIPNLVIDDFQIFGNEDARKVDTTFELCVLPSENLKNRLNSLHGRDMCHSVELEKELSAQKKLRRKSELGDAEGAARDDLRKPNAQTLVVKERDIDYQAFRMCLFRKLLASHPYCADILCAEAKKDIPPFYRAAVWAALLNVYEAESREEFARLDTFSEHASDRQLQYDELMTSPVAHYKLKVLLKAWLISSAANSSGYVYWQGLDSLAAPFLVLHFNNIPVAFRCLSEFIQRFLRNFFLKDNSDTIQGYLSVFMLLVEFVDPELSAHLRALDFPPQLFAIPWFLTCFAHVLPLHKLFHLWDSLLLADASFPLFIGVAILAQLRPQLIHAQFNDAILLFSDLPDLSIDSVVSDSNKFYYSVPASCTHSEHGERHCVPSLRLLLQQLIDSSSRLAPSSSASFLSGADCGVTAAVSSS